ncbi:MAG: ATP-binding cassette subfamily B multidrug efflux pump [Salibacteraceae bacterium]|jgi:ATP-binding cassette subfamily B multidrug efflux pump
MRSLFQLNKYFFKYKWRLLLGLLFITVSNLFAIFPAQIIRIAFDMVGDTVTRLRILEGFELRSSYYEFMTLSILAFGIVVFAMALIKGFFTFLNRQTIIVMSRLIEFDLKNDIFSHYQSLDSSFYKKNSTGDLMNRISEDVSRVRMYFGPAIMYTTNMIVVFILVVWAMLSVSVELTLYVLVPLPILSVSIYYVSHIINVKSEKVQRQLSTISTFVQEAFSGIRVFKAYNLGQFRDSIFEEETEKYKSVNLELVKVNALFMPLMVLLIGLSTIITIFIGGKLAIAGEISSGNIAEFVIYVNMLTWPVAVVGWVTSMVQRAAASQKRINEFLDTTPVIISPTDIPSTITGDISFKNVSFTYPDSGTLALKNVSFDVKHGQSMAITGRTGSGKSTIAQLLTRLYDTSSGEVLINGTSIKELNLSSLRSNIGYVTQDVFLFSDSISNNISFGTKKENIGTEDVKNAAIKADIYDNIMQLNNGFDTEIGERGVTLSGGQKQRISMARALVTNPEILILDDSLSAVDTETEDTILKHLKTFMNGRTTLIISHRISSIKHCDKIVVLDEGEIIETGSHKEIMQNDGLYKRLYEQQLLEDKKPVDDKLNL